MTSSARKLHDSLMRISRKAVVMLVLVTYLFAGALHGFCDIDVTNPSGMAVVSLSESGSGKAAGENAVVAEHHCHGCFSVSVPAPATTAAVVELAIKTVFHHDTDRRDVPHGIDLPPPKTLT